MKQFECAICKLKMSEDEALLRVLDVFYRTSTQKFIAYTEITCPICKSLTAMEYETFNLGASK